jgi:hypothetical protein
MQDTRIQSKIFSAKEMRENQKDDGHTVAEHRPLAYCKECNKSQDPQVDPPHCNSSLVFFKALSLIHASEHHDVSRQKLLAYP